MTPPTAEKLAYACARCIGVAAVVTLLAWASLINSLACTSVKGQDVTRHVDNSRTEWVATTQRADALRVERLATTQHAGGNINVNVSGVDIDVTRDRVRVQTNDATSATSRPSTITVDRTTTDQDSRLDSAAKGRTRAAVTDELKIGPTYSGGNADVSVDGDSLSSRAVRSKLVDRWPITLALAAAGAFYFFLLRNTITGIGFFAAAAASLVLSNFWFLAICAGVIVVAVLPHLRTSKLYTRLVAQMEDWKSDMPAGSAEREAFDNTLAIAARGSEQYVDQVRVRAKHTKVARPVPAVPEPAQ